LNNKLKEFPSQQRNLSPDSLFLILIGAGGSGNELGKPEQRGNLFSEENFEKGGKFSISTHG
jgi:hypothetical protein